MKSKFIINKISTIAIKYSLFVLICTCVIYAQTPNPQITTYGHNATGAYAIDVDDFPYIQFKSNGFGNIAHIPICESYGVVLSFALSVKDCYNEESYGEPIFDSLRAWHARGFEMANHTWTHKIIKTTNYEDQILQAQDSLESLFGERPYFFVYPEDVYTDAHNDYLRENDYVIATGGEQEEDNPLTVNAADWTDCIEAGYRCMNDGLTETQQRNFFNGYIDEIIEEGGWGIRMIHSLDYDYGWGGVYEHVFDEHLAYVKGKIDSGLIWMSTCTNMGKYIQERAAHSVSLTSASDDTIEIDWTLGDLDTSIYNYPLTIKIDMPTNYDNIGILQNGVDLAYTELTNDSIWFEANPNAGKILIINGIGSTDLAKTGKAAVHSNFYLSCTPNPVIGKAVFSYTVPKQLSSQKTTVSVYNVTGKKVYSWEPGNQVKGTYRLEWNGKDMHGGNLANGVYTYQVRIGGTSRSGKIMLIKN